MTSDSEARRRLYRDLNRARADNAELQGRHDELQEAHGALLEKDEAQHEALVHIDQLASTALEASGVYDPRIVLVNVQRVAREQLWTPTMNTSEWGDAA